MIMDQRCQCRRIIFTILLLLDPELADEPAANAVIQALIRIGPRGSDGRNRRRRSPRRQVTAAQKWAGRRPAGDDGESARGLGREEGRRGDEQP